MADEDQSRIIADNPIGHGPDPFNASFSSMCKEKSISSSPDALGQLGQEGTNAGPLVTPLTSVQNCRISHSVFCQRFKSFQLDLLSDILKLTSALNSDDFDLDRIKPLLKAAVISDPTILLSGIELQRGHRIHTTSPPISSSIQQRPWSQNTSVLVNSSEFRLNVVSP
ncbi:hypothetical protein BGZ63DRAFT_422088 [Mariannaea sp. PMI_226]|nr:hypothetical protein BGZ63DRAFT_422088 [Mariannaea sp. PMI_226]